MSPKDARQLAGTPHNRGGGRVGHRWGRTKRKIGFLTVAAHHDLDRGPVATDATDFATFIVTAPRTPIPEWLPKTRIWYDLERFGLPGAAAVLVSRVQER